MSKNNQKKKQKQKSSNPTTTIETNKTPSFNTHESKITTWITNQKEKKNTKSPSQIVTTMPLGKRKLLILFPIVFPSPRVYPEPKP